MQGLGGDGGGDDVPANADCVLFLLWTLFWCGTLVGGEGGWGGDDDGVRLLRRHLAGHPAKQH